MITLTKKRVLSVVGTILLGAIGSGLWNIAIDPFFSLIGRNIIYFGSFGFNIVRNLFYMDIAKGHHDQSSLLILATMLFVGSFLLGNNFPFKKRTEKQINEYRNKIISKELGKNIKLDDIEYLEVLERFTLKFKFKVYLFYIFFFSMFVFKFITNSYTNKTITDFNQSFLICKPYMETGEENTIMSKFYQIQSKEDLEVIIKRLNEIAEENNLKLPNIFLI